MRIQTPEATLSYPAIWEPRAFEDGDTPEYSGVLVFSAGTDLSELNAAAAGVAKERWGGKAGEVMRNARYKPFRNGGEKYGEGTIYITTRSKTTQPGVVANYPETPGSTRPELITDRSQVYPGVVVKALVSPYAYDKKGNKGVGWGLDAIQIIRDGERLDGRVNAQDEFEADMDAVANLDDLTDEDGGEPTSSGTGTDDSGLDLADLL